jgi:hypothetical protein
MPLQNRVNPWGGLFRSPARGTMMGNRGGALHNDNREIVRTFQGHRWIACLLEFKGRHRPVMAPSRYTELFFLDEAVALAAGHRPCAECRRDRFNAFRYAWARRADPGRQQLPRADEMDADLHAARIDGHGKKITFEADVNAMPDGAFIQIGEAAYLVHGDALLLWTPAAYATKQPRPNHLNITVLTPQPILECLRAGYAPDLHPSWRVL